MFVLKRIWWFCRDNWKIVVPAIVLLVLVVFLYRFCNKPAKLDEKEIQQGEKAVKDANDEELRKILTNSDVREKAIDANVANAEAEKEKAVEESRATWANANRDELQAEFDRRLKESK